MVSPTPHAMPTGRRAAPGWPELIVAMVVLALVAYGGAYLLRPLGSSPLVHGLALSALSGVVALSLPTPTRRSRQAATRTAAPA